MRESATTDLSAPPPVLDSRVLPNGLRVLTSTMAYARSVTVSFYFGAGSRYEGDADAGISHLVEHCCFKGTPRRPSAQQISEAIESVGGVLNAGTDRELTVYYAKVPRDHLETALDIVIDMVLRPIFDADELEKERNVILEELAGVEDSPSQLVEIALDSLLWPEQPLGRDVAGTPESVRAISRARAVAYRRDQYAPTNAMISVAGAADPDRVAAIVESATAEWDHGLPGSWEAVKPPAPDHPQVRLRHKATEQAHLMLAVPGVSAVDPDRYAVSLLAGLLGDGMSSRLFVSLREDLGLAYDVHAYAATYRDTGSVAIYMGVDPDNSLEALLATLAELRRLGDGIPAEELRKVLEYTKGRMLLNMEDTRAVSSWYGGQALLLDRTLSVEEVVAKIETVTSDDLVGAANTLFRDENLYLAVVGPFEGTSPFEAALHL